MPAGLIRSMLSVPGIRERFLEKAQDVPADLLSFDLEDSVAWDDKPTARAILARTLPDFPAKGRAIFVRTNGHDTGLLEKDLEGVVGPWLDGINISKVEGPRDIHRLDDYLAYIERTRGMVDGRIAVIPWIENAKAAINAYEICTASPRIIGVCVGGEDYSVSIGVRRTKGGAELHHVRRVTINAAHAAGITPLDTPWTDLADAEGYEAELAAGREIGFRGKFCIHPDQVPVANRTYAPNDDDLDWARRVVESYEDAVARNLGALALDDRMIDKPVYDQALEVIAWSERIQAQGAQS